MAEALSTKSDVAYRRCLIFSLDKSVYGIEATDALQIVRRSELISVPGAPANVAGAMAFRQEVYGICRLSRLLDVTAQSEEWIILLRHPVRRIGIAVGAVLRIERVRVSALQSLEDSRLIRDIVTDQDTIPFLNVGQLFRQF